MALTYAVALVVVLLVLTAQFESFMSAAVIMATVPFGLAALFTLYLTPVVYLALTRFAKPRAGEGARLERELRDAASALDRARARAAR